MVDYTSVEVSFTDSKCRRRRYHFEPRNAGGWVRIEEIRRDGDWRMVGREIVTDVTVDTDAP